MRGLSADCLPAERYASADAFILRYCGDSSHFRMCCAMFGGEAESASLKLEECA